MAKAEPNEIVYSKEQLAEHERREKKAEGQNKALANPREDAPADETPEVAAPPAPAVLPEKETKTKRR